MICTIQKICIGILFEYENHSLLLNTFDENFRYSVEGKTESSRHEDFVSKTQNVVHELSHAVN